MKWYTCFLALLLAANWSCKQHETAAPAPDPRADPHSFSQPNVVKTTHLDLQLKVDFEKRILTGTAAWAIENKGGDELILDTRDLDIQSVTLGEGQQETQYFLVEPDSVLGSALRVKIGPDTRLVTVRYATKPGAAALGWLDASQTAGKKQPFLYTQGQAILTRTWIPCQDSPGNRVTYSASVEVPPGMMAVMSAENPQQKTANGVYQFAMQQPVPPYLIALAVGDLAFQPISGRTGVYAEPSLLQKVAWEFADMEKMVAVAESLYGPYAWGRYDVIVLPPGFPFGGMENPRLTFATPTVVTGDRSLVALVAHELAHSWSGNLVTNATWNDFWLNEGFTVYFERRIMEALYGKPYADMLAVLEDKELSNDLADLGEDSPDTALKLNLKGRDPDEGMTMVAYQKGNYFLQMLEGLVGREHFDAFLKKWFEENKFQARTTEDFLAFLQENLLKKHNVSANVDEWVYRPGLPANCPRPVSEKLAAAQAAAAKVQSQMPDTAGWTSHEWVQFVRYLPENVDVATLKKLDAAYALSRSGNAEVLCAWFEVAIRRGYSAEVLPVIEAFLTQVGRRRLLMPLYRAFQETGQSETAKRIFEQAKPGYHAVTRESVHLMVNE